MQNRVHFHRGALPAVAGIAALTLVTTSIAVAAMPDPGTHTFHGCVNKATGGIFLASIVVLLGSLIPALRR